MTTNSKGTDSVTKNGLEDIKDTNEVVSKLAFIFRNIFRYHTQPQSYQRESRLKITRIVISGNILSRLVDLYKNNDCPENTRADIMYIIWRMAGNAEESDICKALRESVPNLLQALVTVSDKNIVCRLMFVIDSLAHDEEWNSTRKYLIRSGFLDIMTVLLVRWQADKAVLITLLWTLSNLTLRTTKFNINKVMLVDGSRTTLPAVLQKILQDIVPTDENQSLIQRTLRNIEGLLFGNNFFHRFFTNAEFVDCLFNLFQSKHLSDENKHKILFKIITNLTCNNPKDMKKLLVPHAEQLQDIATFHRNGDASRAAATILKKYLSCEKESHECRVVSSVGKWTIMFFILSYTIDLIGDIIIGYNTITDPDFPLKKEGYLLLVFSIVPLIYINVLSYQQFKKSNHHMLYTDQAVSLQGHFTGAFLSYLFHWRWDTPKHVLFNILTLLQMHPIIASIEVLCHKPQEMLSVLNKLFNFTRINLQEKILENVPCIFLKLLIMYKTNKAIRDRSTSDGNQFPRTDDHFTLITTVFSVMSLIASMIKFEKLCRSATTSICSDLMKAPQTIALNVGFLSMITSRMFMCLVLFHLLEHSYSVFALCITMHIFLTFLSHVFSYHIQYDPFYGLNDKRSFPVINFIRNKYYNENIRNFPFSMVKRVLLVFALSWGEFFVVMLRHPIEFLQGHPHVQHQRSGRHFALIYLVHLLELVAVSAVCFLSHDHTTRAFHAGYMSIALHLVSGGVFLVYFRYLHPDNSEDNLSSLHTSNRMRLINVSNQCSDFVPIWQQFCNVTTTKHTTFNLDGEKVFKAEQYNYRMEEMRACVVCAMGLEHKEGKAEDQNQRSEAEELERLICRVRGVNALYAELPNLDKAIELNAGNVKFLDIHRLNTALKAQIERKYQVLDSRLKQDSNTGLSDFRDTCQTYFYWSAIQWESAVRENSRIKPSKRYHVITVM